MQKHREETFAAVHPVIPDIPKDLPVNVTGIPKQLLPSSVTTITQLPAEILLQQIADGNLTSTAVTTAFLQRAGLASKLTNCVTELLPSRALERAKELDAYYTEHKKPIGPLHGLPISSKEHVGMKGLDLNTGFVSWVGRKGQDDATILKLLWQAGCVFYARTTEPQTLMHLETDNNIYGVTTNPYNTGLTSGGSSGGEGALLGMHGSCLGIGTDIGGSIRSPAANQGVFGFRPTSYRLPMGGVSMTSEGEEHIIAVIGPLSNSLEGINIFMKALIDQKPWLHEPSLLPFPWRSQDPLLHLTFTGTRKLRVGILADDGIVKPHPPILRGISTLKSKLEAHPDIQVVDFPPYKHDKAWRIIASLYFADGALEEQEALEASGEPWLPLTDWILKDQNPHFGHTLRVPDIWKLTQQREEYRTAYLAHWNSVGISSVADNADTAAAGAAVAVSTAKMSSLTVEEQESMVDVVLCPVGPGTAPPHDMARYWGYTSQWNLLDYPCLVFPTGLACGDEDVREEGYRPPNVRDASNYELCECCGWAWMF